MDTTVLRQAAAALRALSRAMDDLYRQGRLATTDRRYARRLSRILGVKFIVQGRYPKRYGFIR